MGGHTVGRHPRQPGRLPRRVPGSDPDTRQVTRPGTPDPHGKGDVRPSAAVLARGFQPDGQGVRADVDPVNLLASLAESRVPRCLASVDGTAESRPGTTRLHMR